jgi:signal transduction histidine kinase/ActR/RegA family two-component response regulator
VTITTNESRNPEDRVLVFMPTGRDASLVCATLQKSNITAQTCADSDELISELEKGAGAVLLAEEGLEGETFERLSDTFNRQPVWSDIPVVLFASNGRSAETLLKTVGTRFNATIVERPIRITMLISAVRSVLRAREKQYQTRDLLNQLEEADHQKDLFLATLSHELRTPLNSMLGWIQLLRGETGKQIDTKYGLDVIERNAKAQSEIISDILFVSQVITGKLTLNTETIDINSVVQRAIDVIHPTLEAKNIQLRTSFDSGASQIKGDADRLQQVFLNLFSNAIKFTPENGQIEVRIKRDGSNAEVEVADSGRGIKSEFLPFVFERFRQADNSYTRQVGGLGLGLAIVRHLIEMHGGTVAVESGGENKGATFKITLPLIIRQQTQEFSQQDSDKSLDYSETDAMLRGVRVLLVEDNEDSRDMLKIMFEQHGMETTAVDSAAEALSAIEQFQPDILISDVGLPGEDGYELISKIRQLPSEQGGSIPAVALTGYASLQDRVRAFDVGYQEHLAKPVDIDKLLELMKDLVIRKEFPHQNAPNH